jgi:hypothetical protein
VTTRDKFGQLDAAVIVRGSGIDGTSGSGAGRGALDAISARYVVAVGISDVVVDGSAVTASGDAVAADSTAAEDGRADVVASGRRDDCVLETATLTVSE